MIRDVLYSSTQGDSIMKSIVDGSMCCYANTGGRVALVAELARAGATVEQLLSMKKVISSNWNVSRASKLPSMVFYF